MDQRNPWQRKKTTKKSSYVDYTGQNPKKPNFPGWHKAELAHQASPPDKEQFTPSLDQCGIVSKGMETQLENSSTCLSQPCSWSQCATVRTLQNFCPLKSLAHYTGLSIRVWIKSIYSSFGGDQGWVECLQQSNWMLITIPVSPVQAAKENNSEMKNKAPISPALYM